MKTKQISDKLLKQALKLSPTAKLILAGRMFGSGLEQDNYGQHVIYTGMCTDSKTKRARKITNEDFEKPKFD